MLAMMLFDVWQNTSVENDLNKKEGFFQMTSWTILNPLVSPVAAKALEIFFCKRLSPKSSSK